MSVTDEARQLSSWLDSTKADHSLFGAYAFNLNCRVIDILGRLIFRINKLEEIIDRQDNLLKELQQ